MVDFAPLRRLRVQQVQPFTYRDGITFLELLERLTTHVKEVLEPSLKNVIDDLVEQLTVEMGEHRDSYVEGVEEFQRIHDVFMADVQSSIRAANDMNFADLMDDPTSLTGSKLRDDYTRTAHLDSQVAELLQDNTSEARQVLAAMVTEILGKMP